MQRSKRATSQKTKPTAEGEASAQGEQQKRKRGRPSKAKNVKVMEPPEKVPPVGVGVYTSAKDGNTYFSTVGGSMIKVSSSKPPPPKPPVSSSQSVPSLRTYNKKSKELQSSSQLCVVITFGLVLI